MSKKILITGFGPFAGRGENGSEKVVRCIGETGLPGLTVTTLVLPVLWSAVDTFQVPGDVDYCLVLGEGHPWGVYTEQVVTRIREGKDESGTDPSPAPKGDRVLHTHLSWTPTQLSRLGGREPKLKELGLRECDVGITSNNFAGFYLCNGIGYMAARAAEERKGDSRRRLKTGLVHVPPLEYWERDNPKGNYALTFAAVVRLLLWANGWTQEET